MNNIVIWHLYTLQSDHHNISSYHLSQYKGNSLYYVPYAVDDIPITYIFYIWKSVLLTPFPILPLTSNPSSLETTNLISVYVRLLLFFIFIFLDFNISKITGICFSLYGLFHLNEYPIHPHILLEMARFHYFYGWVVFHCIYGIEYIINSSTDGHIGCFQILAVVNNSEK